MAPPQFLPSSCPLSALLCFTLLCSAPVLLLPCSFKASIRHIPISCPVPAQLLPSFCPALLYSAQLCSCPVLALVLPRSCFSPALALLQPCSCPAPAPGPAHPSLAAFIIISTSRLFFGTARAALYHISMLQVLQKDRKYPWNRRMLGSLRYLTAYEKGCFIEWEKLLQVP